MLKQKDFVDAHNLVQALPDDVMKYISGGCFVRITCGVENPNFVQVIDRIGMLPIMNAVIACVMKYRGATEAPFTRARRLHDELRQELTAISGDDAEYVLRIVLPGVEFLEAVFDPNFRIQDMDL